MSIERQNYHLQKVSRTFALTIPLLPKELQDWVGNAYLLCRIADTIEDDPKLSNDDKKAELQNFIDVLNCPVLLESWSNSIADKLKASAKESEVYLLKDIEYVVGRYYSYNETVRHILRHGVDIMRKGMSEFGRWENISNLHEVDCYCYCVAGVVGELLTYLFAEHSTKIKSNLNDLLPLSVSFGEGLQLTNILKDIWDDLERGIHWLPLGDSETEKEIKTKEYVSIAYGHTLQALDYIKQMPRKEKGIREFCLLANLLAIATLCNIYKNPLFKKASDVKISRKTVKRIFIYIKLFSFSNKMIDRIAKRLAKDMKATVRDAIKLRKETSYW